MRRPLSVSRPSVASVRMERRPTLASVLFEPSSRLPLEALIATFPFVEPIITHRVGFEKFDDTIFLVVLLEVSRRLCDCVCHVCSAVYCVVCACVCVCV